MEKLNKTFIIAEIGQAHDGSLGIAHSYIDALASLGVNAVKFQTHIAEAESSMDEEFRVKFSYEDKTRFEYWKRMEFSLEQWIGLKNHCETLGVEFISSPFSCAAVDLLERVGVSKYKIGSGEVKNRLLIDKICKTEKEIYMSTGMSSFSEIDESITWMESHRKKVSIFQCTTEYPTSPKDWGLGMINDMKQRYKVPVGFSDHSGDIYAPLSAVTLGADLLEFHAVFSKSMFGPDSKASLTMDQISTLIKGVRQIEQARDAVYCKDDVEKFFEIKKIFGKSLCVNKDLKAGHILKACDLEAKKPSGRGIAPEYYRQLVGRKINSDLLQWQLIELEHLETKPTGKKII